MATVSKSTKPTRHQSGKKRYTLNSILATVGYILSPLSWWNDMVVNVPLAYTFSVPFAFISEQLFLPAFVLGYWLTNLLGFILMHKGVMGIVSQQPYKLSVWRHIVIALVYTAIIMLMVWFEWVPMPTDLINQLK